MVSRSPENEKRLDVVLEWAPAQGPDGKPTFILTTTSGCGRPGQSLGSIGGSCLNRTARFSLWWERPTTCTKD